MNVFIRREESVSEISRPTLRRREIELVPMYSSRCSASSRKLSVFSERVVRYFFIVPVNSHAIFLLIHGISNKVFKFFEYSDSTTQRILTGDYTKGNKGRIRRCAVVLRALKML